MSIGKIGYGVGLVWYMAIAFLIGQGSSIPLTTWLIAAFVGYNVAALAVRKLF